MLSARKKMLILLFLGSLLMFNICCSIPQKSSSRKDIKKSEVESIESEKQVLIASQNSDFKNAIIAKLKDSFSEDGINFKLTGLNELKDESADNYSAIVIVNTCIAWGMDQMVDSFLNRHKDNSNIIVLTTSGGDGNWLPEKKDRKFDAISSASDMADVDEIADKIISEVRSRI